MEASFLVILVSSFVVRLGEELLSLLRGRVEEIFATKWRDILGERGLRRASSFQLGVADN